jgi:hypothetical protein
VSPAGAASGALAAASAATASALSLVACRSGPAFAAPVALTATLGDGVATAGDELTGDAPRGAALIPETMGRVGAVVPGGEVVGGPAGDVVLAGVVLAAGSLAGVGDTGAGGSTVDEGAAVTGAPVTDSPEGVAGSDGAGAGAGVATATAVPENRKPFGHEELYSCDATPFFSLAVNDACSPTASTVTRPPPAAVMIPACTAAVQMDESSV